MSLQLLRLFEQANDGIAALVQRDVLAFMSKLDPAKPDAVKSDLFEYIPTLIAKYGDVAATVAADWYDELRALEGVDGKFSASPADLVPDEVVNGRLGYATREDGPLYAGEFGTLTEFVSMMSNQYALQPGRDTVMQAAHADNAAYARVPERGACKFCLMLASRGFVYSKDTAGDSQKFHGKCRCNAMPVWDEERARKEYGYDPDDLYDQYRAARDKPAAKAFRWDEGRDVDVRGGERPAFDPKNPLAFYGNTLDIADKSAVTETHLKDLEFFSPAAHSKLREHFADSKSGGFYFGDATVPDLDNQGHLKGVRPRGWAEGQTWDNVPGAYDPNARVCACGGGGGGHGSTSLALHEGSHALDHAHGRVSESKGWQEAFYKMHGSARMNPYFTYEGNQSGFLSEGFAESYAAWSKYRDTESGADLRFRIEQALGADRSNLDVTDASQGIIDFFEAMDKKLA